MMLTAEELLKQFPIHEDLNKEKIDAKVHKGLFLYLVSKQYTSGDLSPDYELTQILADKYVSPATNVPFVFNSKICGAFKDTYNGTFTHDTHSTYCEMLEEITEKNERLKTDHRNAEFAVFVVERMKPLKNYGNLTVSNKIRGQPSYQDIELHLTNMCFITPLSPNQKGCFIANWCCNKSESVENVKKNSFAQILTTSKPLQKYVKQNNLFQGCWGSNKDIQNIHGYNQWVRIVNHHNSVPKSKKEHRTPTCLIQSKFFSHFSVLRSFRMGAKNGLQERIKSWNRLHSQIGAGRNNRGPLNKIEDDIRRILGNGFNDYQQQIFPTICELMTVSVNCQELKFFDFCRGTRSKEKKTKIVPIKPKKSLTIRRGNKNNSEESDGNDSEESDGSESSSSAEISVEDARVHEKETKSKKKRAKKRKKASKMNTGSSTVSYISPTQKRTKL